MSQFPTIPPHLRQKLLIVEIPEVRKQVRFSDLNEIKTYRKWEPPAAVSYSPKDQRNNQLILTLMERVFDLEQEREMQKIEIKNLGVALDRLSSTAKPLNSKPAANDAGWHNSDIEAPAACPKLTKTQKVAPSNPPSPRRQANQTKPPSKLKRGLMVAGTFISVFGGFGGLMSCLGLGPIGIAIAAGCLVIGIIIHQIGKSID